MSIVDLAKARAYAETIDTDDGTAADWIFTLADEVESLQNAIASARRSEQAALSDAALAADERDAAMTALSELHTSIVTLLRTLTPVEES